jgi:hemin uptake protein HemP
VADEPVKDSEEPPEEDCLRYDSSELFQGHRQIHIVHGDDIYVLRCTRMNKLILHK